MKKRLEKHKEEFCVVCLTYKVVNSVRFEKNWLGSVPARRLLD